MVLFGGNHVTFFGGDIPLNDTWALSLGNAPAWTELSPAGTWPYPMSHHTAIYDPQRDRMLAYGGWRDHKWALYFGTFTTVTLSDVVAEVEGRCVRVEWSAVLDAPAALQVVRSLEADGPYSPVSEEMAGRIGWSRYVYLDTTVSTEAVYWYKVGSRETDSWRYSTPIRVATPNGVFALLAISPNPGGRGPTRLTFVMARHARARLDIYDARGRRVRAVADAIFGAGVHRVTWDGRGQDGRALPPGIYFARLAADAVVSSRKVVVARREPGGP
jgi:hypothetical protein